MRSENTGGATGLCLEVHDLVLSKCAAGRERDWDFAEQAIRHGFVDPKELLRRLDDMPLEGSSLDALRRVVEGAIARAGAGGS